jgi:diguanylate cyclase (GGDEF)-like protein
MDRLDRALRDVRARRRPRIAIILVDVDRFRLINDTLGHTAGDELMLQAARRFEKATASLECVLARWGGDQFAVLAFDVPSADAAFAIADTLQEALQEPFELRKHRLSIAARMGVTSVESGLQRAEDALREADIALSAAKHHDSAKIVAYVPSMGGDAASLVSIEADLHVALERNELRLLFQPIVDLRAERIVGAEALLRWKHPVEGVLAPDKFLAIAEEAGLIVQMTRWVILRVCRLASEWRRRLPPETPFYFSINLSAAALRDPGFTDYVAQILRDTGMPAQALKFELTEGGLISNVGGAREVLDRLHAMGIELMLDDFGTGYSSLSYLQLFPFDYLKIDRPLVNPTGSEQMNNGITAAVLQMASSLGLKAIAEIVETPAAARALANMGCEYGQGYFFSEPLEAEEALQRLRAQGLRLPATPSLPKEDDSPTLILPAWETEDEVDEASPPLQLKRG